MLQPSYSSASGRFLYSCHAGQQQAISLCKLAHLAIASGSRPVSTKAAPEQQQLPWCPACCPVTPGYRAPRAAVVFSGAVQQPCTTEAGMSSAREAMMWLQLQIHLTDTRHRSVSQHQTQQQQQLQHIASPLCISCPYLPPSPPSHSPPKNSLPSLQAGLLRPVHQHGPVPQKSVGLPSRPGLTAAASVESHGECCVCLCVLLPCCVCCLT